MKSTEIIRQVYEIQRRTLGEDHPEILISLFNLAVGYGALGEYNKALELARKAYDGHMRILGGEHPDTFAALNYLADCVLNLGDLATARRLAGQALELTIVSKTFDRYEQTLIRDCIGSRIPADLDRSVVFAG